MAVNKFRLTFVYPDFESLGVEYLMAQSLKSGYEVKLVYYQAENAYLAKKQRGLDFSAIAYKIIATCPDLVCFSCVSDNYQYQLKVAKALKRIKPKLPTIFGGVHPTAVPKVVLSEPAVDVVAIGEAEISFANFLESCQLENNQLTFPNKEIDGIVFKENGREKGKFKEGKLIDLNKLSFPYKDPFVDSLKETSFRYALITSRGCPYNCSYCIQSTIHKRRGKRVIRQRSVSNVMAELLWAKSKYQFKVVYFMDDLFTANKKWLWELLRLYKRKIGLPFGCATHPECLDQKTAQLLGKAGCIFASFGVQSLSPLLSKEVLTRALNREKIIQAIEYLKQAGIMVQADHILGIPGDIIKNQEEAVLFYNQYRPDLVSVFWLTYYPKTPIVDIALKKKILSYSDVKKIENGKKITDGNFHDGGSLKNPKPYYPIQFMLNYFTFLPKWLVGLLIKTGWYRIFKMRNFYFSTALPRTLLSLVDKRYFWGRSLLVSFLNK